MTSVLTQNGPHNFSCLQSVRMSATIHSEAEDADCHVDPKVIRLRAVQTRRSRDRLGASEIGGPAVLTKSEPPF